LGREVIEMAVHWKKEKKNPLRILDGCQNCSRVTCLFFYPCSSSDAIQSTTPYGCSKTEWQLEEFEEKRREVTFEK